MFEDKRDQHAIQLNEVTEQLVGIELEQLRQVVTTILESAPVPEFKLMQFARGQVFGLLKQSIENPDETSPETIYPSNIAKAINLALTIDQKITNDPKAQNLGIESLGPIINVVQNTADNVISGIKSPDKIA